LIRYAVAGLFRLRAALQTEVLALRHQLNALRRRAPKRVAVSNIDRLVFAGFYHLAPEVFLKPETIIRWHRAGFRARWRWKSRPRGGRPRTPDKIRRFILAPKGTPKEIIDPLNAATAQALADPAVQSRLANLGGEIFPRERQTPEAQGSRGVVN
jgi:hypothetical protein